jgi:cytoskeletal protein CcmA (bactofilin family)
MRTVRKSEITMTESGEKNSILNSVQIKGTIRFAKELTFDGTLEGDITSHGGTLIIGGNGKIRGNVRANSVIVKGKVTGNITAESRCELHGGAELIGDLKTARLVLEAGAMFVGRSEVNPSNIPIGQPRATQDIGAAAPVAGVQKVITPQQRQETLSGVKS